LRFEPSTAHWMKALLSRGFRLPRRLGEGRAWEQNGNTLRGWRRAGTVDSFVSWRESRAGRTLEPGSSQALGGDAGLVPARLLQLND
jgi:hypothetical protein